MSEANNDTGEHASKRTDSRHTCRRCDASRDSSASTTLTSAGSVFREVARDMGFEKYS